ncbi:MAG TPA: helix-turn-helix transcriptional regulator [Gemmatimonadales bacterium]
MQPSGSIPRGWHFGTADRSRCLGRFILTDARYPAGLRTPWHAHEAPAFSLMLRGRNVQRFRRREVVYRSSVAVFRPSGIEHSDRISPRGAASFIVEPDPTWLEDVGLGRLDHDRAIDHAGPRARWLLEHVLREFRSPDETTPLALEGLVLALAAEFARAREPRLDPRCPPWLLRTRDSLDAAFAARVTLSNLAADAGVHPVYLAAAFRKAFGSSVGGYVRARRLEAARLALRDPARSINEIALTLGFSSQSHFTQVFRQATGLTPLAYRRVDGKP